MKNVLITSGEPRMAYVMSKALVQHGYTVYTGDTSSFSMPAFSRYTAGSMIYTAPKKDKEQFIADLETFIQEKNIQILIPSLDETFILAEYRDRLSKCVHTVLPSYEKICLVHDKHLITEESKKIGIAVPETWEATELLSATNELDKLPFPVIIKPKKGKGGWGTEKLVDSKSLKNALQTTENLHEYIIQRFIEGEVVATCAIYDNGRCVVRDSYIATAVYPLKVGQPTRRKSEHFEDALNALTKLLDHLQWHGLCEIDFIIDAQSGVSYLLDVNPRCWSSVAQNIAGGTNYPLYYCEIALGQEKMTPQVLKHVQTRFLSADIQRIAAEFFSEKNKLRYIKNLFFKHERFDAHDDWDCKDPLPFFCWWIKAIHRKLFTR